MNENSKPQDVTENKKAPANELPTAIPSKEEIIQFFNQKRTFLVKQEDGTELPMQAPCTSCGAGTFALIGSYDGEGAANQMGLACTVQDPANPKQSSDTLIPLPFYGLICQSCGSVQFFSANSVNELIKKKREENGANK